MAYVNLPSSLQAMFDDMKNRLTKLENAQRFTSPNVTADPTIPRNGDLWLNTPSNSLRYVDANGVTQPLNPVSTSGNFVINGGMDFDQRGQSPLGGYLSGYSLDRWYWVTSSSPVKVTQSSTVYPTGFSYSASMSASDNRVTPGTTWGQLVQTIESNNAQLLAGQTVTLSAYMQANTLPSQTVTMAIYTSTNYDDSPTNILVNAPLATKVIVAPSGSAGGGFVRQSMTATIPASAVTVLVSFSVARTNSTDYPSLTNRFYLTGVQLEVGAVASAFHRAGNTYGGELALCQRYYQIFTDAAGGVLCSGTMYGAAGTAFYGVLGFPVVMRIAPTVNVSDVTALNVNAGGAGVASVAGSFASFANPYAVRLNVTRSVASTNGFGAWLQWGTAALGNYIEAVAEL